MLSSLLQSRPSTYVALMVFGRVRLARSTSPLARGHSRATGLCSIPLVRRNSSNSAVKRFGPLSVVTETTDSPRVAKTVSWVAVSLFHVVDFNTVTLGYLL